jgi:hypothetical protein
MVTEYNIFKYSHKMILDLKAIVVSVLLACTYPTSSNITEKLKC